MYSGYVKLWRKMEKSAFFTSSEAVHVFIFLLIRATRVDREIYVGHQKIKLAPGQLVTGRKAISVATGINESKVYRVLNMLKSEQQIEQQNNSKFSIISICNWAHYQEDEQQTEHQMNNKRTASEQQVNTNKNVKKVKNEKKESKDIYGSFQNVLLTKEEYEKLKAQFNGSCKDKIEALSEGIKSKGYKYVDHYATILAWDRKDKRDNPRRNMIGAPIHLEGEDE